MAAALSVVGECSSLSHRRLLPIPAGCIRVPREVLRVWGPLPIMPGRVLAKWRHPSRVALQQIALLFMHPP